MNITEITQKIRLAGFYPIHVNMNHDREDSYLEFVGSLEEFFQATKAIGESVIFMSPYICDEDDFLYESESFEENLSDGDGLTSNQNSGLEESFDLTVALPSLSNFKKYLGKECAFFLMAKSQLGALTLYITEVWWDEFKKQQSEAIKKVDEDRDTFREKMEEQQQEKDEDLLKQLRSLLNDSDFCRIKTQRGMKAYALERFPDLKNVNPANFTQEIQKLSDKISMRK